MSTLPPQKRAAALNEAGMRFFNQGLILEAEREFQSALAAESDNADARAGLALVREHEGDSKEARVQAAESLKTKPNVTAYLVLGRLDLQANQKPAAAADVSSALKLEPQNAAARSIETTAREQGSIGSMNRLLSVLMLACCWTLAGQAQQPRVIVIHLDDTIQPISADYMARGLEAAAAQHANAVLIEINTPGGLLDSMRQMVSKVIASPVPVIVYVAPSGSQGRIGGIFPARSRRCGSHGSRQQCRRGASGGRRAPSSTTS